MRDLWPTSRCDNDGEQLPVRELRRKERSPTCPVRALRMKSNMRVCERRVCPSNGRPASRTPLDPHSAGASRRRRECGGTRRLKVVRRRRSARQAVAVGPADPSGGNKARRLGSHADRNRARVGRQARSNLLTTAPAGRVLPLSYGFRIGGAAPMISAARVRRSTWLAALLRAFSLRFVISGAGQVTTAG